MIILNVNSGRKTRWAIKFLPSRCIALNQIIYLLVKFKTILKNVRVEFVITSSSFDSYRMFLELSWKREFFFNVLSLPISKLKICRVRWGWEKNFAGWFMRFISTSERFMNSQMSHCCIPVFNWWMKMM